MGLERHSPHLEQYFAFFTRDFAPQLPQNMVACEQNGAHGAKMQSKSAVPKRFSCLLPFCYLRFAFIIIIIIIIIIMIIIIIFLFCLFAFEPSRPPCMCTKNIYNCRKDEELVRLLRSHDKQTML